MGRYSKPIKDEDRMIKDPERSGRKTFDRAVNLLTYRPRSVRELRTRLLEKAWTNEEIVDEVIGKLSEYNYLNDLQFARNFAASLLRRKAVGKWRLRQDLKRKKLDEDTVEAALEYAYEEIPEDEVIDRALDKRIRIKGLPETHSDRKKLFDHLTRLGFDFDLIRGKLDGLTVSGDDEDAFEASG